MTRKSLLGFTLAALIALGGFVAACGDDDDGGGSEADKQEVTDTITQVAIASGDQPDQVDFWLAHVTDDLITIFYPSGRAECEANPEDCVAEPLSNPFVNPDTLKIDGNSATLTLISDDVTFGVNMLKDDDVWKVDGLFAVSDEIPEGVEKVDLTLAEFAFAFDQESEAVTSGKFAFAVKNDGEQTHEVVVLKIPEDADIEDLLQSEGAPEGVEDIAFKFPFIASDEADMAVPELDAGRYLLICFLPDTDDPEGTPHAFKGTRAEFTVE